MDQATLEMVNNKSGYKRDVMVKINNQMLEVLYSLLSRDTYMREKLRELSRNSQEPYEIPSPLFFDFLDLICRRSDTISSLGNDRFENVEFLKGYAEQYYKALDQYDEFRKGEEDHNSFTTNLFSDETRMKTFIDLTFRLEQESKRLCVVRDLTNAKDDITKNLSYFLDKNMVQEYDNKYNEALNNGNIDEMKRILDDAQGLILNHWKEYVTSIENFKQGDNFKLICHSTANTEFNSEFYTRYVSTSLLSEQLLDTYREGFGFVFAPENIVGACPEDMYVYNGSDDEDNLLFYSTLKRIDAPERLIEECVELKRKNKEEGNKKSVYNEVVIDGFKPIAIFCLTEGAKGLNHNYKYAHRLQEKFPNLKIIEIDTTYYKADEDLFDTKKELMAAANERLLEKSPNYQGMSWEEKARARDITNNQVDRNEIFWTKFLELKKTGNYTEDDIVNLYNHVKEMNSFFLDARTLDQYDDIELESILKNNSCIGTKTIFNKDLSLRDLERVYTKFKEYGNIDRLDRVMPGIKAFVNLFEKKMFTDEVIAEMSKISSYEPLNEYAKTIASEEAEVKEETVESIEEVNVQKKENNRSEKLLKQAQKCIDEITEYQKKKQENNALIDEYNKCRNICDCEYLYELCILDIDWEKKYRLKLKEKARYFESMENSYSAKISELEQELQKLKKHPLIHMIKIRKLKKQIESVNISLQQNIEAKQEALEDINTRNEVIDEGKNSFAKKTGVSFEEYAERLKQAQTRMGEINNIDLHIKNITLEFNITDAQKELKAIEQELTQLGINLESYMLSKNIESSNEEKIEDEKTI